MATRKTAEDTVTQQLLTALLADQAASGEVMIVKTTIIQKLLRSIPRSYLEAFLESLFSTAPKFGDPLFGEWLKTSRQKMGLSQRGLADVLRTDELRVHGSDVGNLEKGLRLDHYTPERAEKIRVEVLARLAEEKTAKT